MQLRQGFTGRHMLMTFVSFFAVVIAVNLYMARSAIASFGGTVVPNSYVASQNFNDWLAEGRRQSALGWQVSAVRLPGGQVQLTALGPDARPLLVQADWAVAEHPLGRTGARTLTFERSGDVMVSRNDLPAGRWRLRVRLRGAGSDYLLEQELK